MHSNVEVRSICTISNWYASNLHSITMCKLVYTRILVFSISVSAEILGNSCLFDGGHNWSHTDTTIFRRNTRVLRVLSYAACNEHNIHNECRRRIHHFLLTYSKITLLPNGQTRGCWRGSLDQRRKGTRGYFWREDNLRNAKKKKKKSNIR